jgi:hypothetical protein
MAIMDLPTVQPGALIRAEFFTQLIDELLALEARVEVLENQEQPTPGPGAPELDRREPTGDVKVGGQLTLFGRNFSPLAFTRVRMGGAPPITVFGPGSTDTRLSFQVPDAFEDLPRLVSLTVSNPQGTSNPLTRIRVVESRPPQGGEVFADDRTQALGTIAVDTAYALKWLVRSETLLPATYDFTPLVFDVDPVSTVDAWNDAISLNSSHETISAEEPFEVELRVTVPHDAVSAKIALHVESTDRQFERTSNPVTLTVDEEPVLSDPKVGVVTVKPPKFDEDGNLNRVHLVGDAIEVEFGAIGAIPVEIQLRPEETKGGRYQFRSDLADAGGGRWQLRAIDPDEIILDPDEETTIQVGIRNNGTASAPPPPTVITVRAAKRNDANTADEYVSFREIPLRAGDGT